MLDDLKIVAGITFAFLVVGGLLIAFIGSMIRRKHERIESDYRLWRGDVGSNREKSDNAVRHILELGRRWGDEDLNCSVLRSLCIVAAIALVAASITIFFLGQS